MADPMHLIARWIHVGSAMLWVGYLGLFAWIVVPSLQDQEGFDLDALLRRMRLLRNLGPVTFFAGFWLVTASGRSFSSLVQPGSGHAILGGIILAIAMMGLEHGRMFPKLEDASQAAGDARRGALDAAGRSASIACVLGLIAAFLMVLSLLGGF